MHIVLKYLKIRHPLIYISAIALSPDVSAIALSPRLFRVLVGWVLVAWVLANWVLVSWELAN
jgi:hypothetical protein